MKKLILVLTILATGCIHKPPMKEFDSKRKVQTIEVWGQHHIYAQDDVLLTHDSLDKKLSEMNPKWSDDMKSASRYRHAGYAAAFTQIAALGICLFQDSTMNIVGWCSGSIVAGLLGAHWSTKAGNLQFGVVNGFNQGHGR